MPEKQIDLSKIKSSMVGFNIPFCIKHNRKHVIDSTRRNLRGEVLEVFRYHHCEDCRREGIEDPPPLINSRDFSGSATV